MPVYSTVVIAQLIDPAAGYLQMWPNTMNVYLIMPERRFDTQLLTFVKC